MTLQDLLDQKVRDAGVQTRYDRKWCALTAVFQTEIMLEKVDMLSNMKEVTRQKRLECHTFSSAQRLTRRKGRSIVQGEVKCEKRG